MNYNFLLSCNTYQHPSKKRGIQTESNCLCLTHLNGCCVLPFFSLKNFISIVVPRQTLHCSHLFIPNNQPTLWGVSLYLPEKLSSPRLLFSWIASFKTRRDQAFSSPILRKMKHWTHINKHVQAEFSHAFWQCVANFTVHFILVAAAPFPIHFSCEYLHIVSSLECTCWQIDDVPLICWYFVHLHVFSCTAVSIMQHNILFQHRPHGGLH